MSDLLHVMALCALGLTLGAADLLAGRVVIGYGGGGYRSHRTSHAQIRNRSLRNRPPPERKTYADILERSQKSAASALENEVWRQELGSALPAGYGTVNLALLSNETKALLKENAEKNKQAEAARVAAGEAAAAQPLQPRALEHLQQMFNYVANQQHFLMQAEEIREEMAPTDTRGQFRVARRMLVNRPDKLKVTSEGPTMKKEVWFDGQSIAVHNGENNVYGQSEAPASIDALLEKLQVEEGISLPLTDLLYSRPFDVVKDNLSRARYLGRGTIDNTPCHQVACASGPVEWQVWIQSEGPPLMRRIMIVYRNEPGVPRYTARITELQSLDGGDDTPFRFEAPDGAQKVSLAEAAR